MEDADTDMNYFAISENYDTFALLKTIHTSPDGGIGRRAGLKHQWSNPCRFDPGFGYWKPSQSNFYEGFLFFRP